MVTSRLDMYRFRKETHFALISRQVRKTINCEDRNPLTKTIRHSGSIRHKCGHSGHSGHSGSIRLSDEPCGKQLSLSEPRFYFLSLCSFVFLSFFCVSLSHCLLAFRLFVYFPFFGYFHTNRIHFSVSLAYFFCPHSTWTVSASHPI